MKKKIVLITGGAGFIGSHLCERMLEEGYRVICLDNLDNYYDPKVKLNNIREIKKDKNFTFIKKDICDSKAVGKIFRSNRLDIVVHLAAKAGVRPSIQNPSDYVEVNIKGTLNLLEACRKYNVKKFVFASSSSVYGSTKRNLFSEDDSVNSPVSPYGATKKSGEVLCYTYHHLYGLNIVCLRFFTVYGPRQRPDLAIHKFIRLAFQKKVIPMFGDGSSKRDYTYIDDVLKGITNTIKFMNKSKKPIFEIINLGRGKPILLKELISLIEKETGLNIQVKRMAWQLGDMARTMADVRKAKKMLSYKPTTNFRLGLNKFVEWYKEKNSKLHFVG